MLPNTPREYRNNDSAGYEMIYPRKQIVSKHSQRKREVSLMTTDSPKSVQPSQEVVLSEYQLIREHSILVIAPRH